MRDPKRIFRFCNRLAAVWTAYAPDMRFGQLIECLFHFMESDPFYIEDDRMIQTIEAFLAQHPASGSQTTGNEVIHP